MLTVGWEGVYILLMEALVDAAPVAPSNRSARADNNYPVLLGYRSHVLHSEKCVWLISTVISTYLHALLQALRDLFLHIGHQNGCPIDLQGMNWATLMSRACPCEVAHFE